MAVFRSSKYMQVFHELARHLQTRRLIAGDSISLDQDRNFYCVIDGTVQVFGRTGQVSLQNGSWDDEDMNGYQLINEVGSGGTLSSLFSILSLFTDQIKLSWQEDASHISSSNPPIQLTSPQKHAGRINTDVSSLDLEFERSPTPLPRNRTASVSSSGSTAHPAGSVPGMTHVFSSEPSPPRSDSIQQHQIHHGHGIIGRATEDSTLAVIPAEAFRRVTKKFPKATGHIVQGKCYQSNIASRDNPFVKVILTRFSRVTFNAAHKYLGLTTEVLRTEKAINEIACHPLPDSFYEGGGLHSLRQRFDDVAVQESDSESDYFSHDPSPPVFSSGKVNSSVSIADSRERLVESPVGTLPARTFPLRARQQVQAGDLLTSIGHGNDGYRSHSRTFSILNTPRVATSKNISFTARLPGDEFDLRDEVMSCIAKSIGLLQPPISEEESIEASPAFLPFDASRSPPGMFTSSFGSLSLLDTGDDSMSSATGSSSNATGYMSGLDNEVEILFFSAGSTLVKTGERNTGQCFLVRDAESLIIKIGLYYVIEGFLDILLPTETQYPALSKTLGSDTESMFAYDQTRSDSGRRETHKLLFTVKPGGIAGYLGIYHLVMLDSQLKSYQLRFAVHPLMSTSRPRQIHMLAFCLPKLWNGCWRSDLSFS